MKSFVGRSALALLSFGAAVQAETPCYQGEPGSGAWIGRAQAEALVAADAAAMRVNRPIMLPVMDYDPMAIALWLDHCPPALCYDQSAPPTQAVIEEVQRSVYQALQRYYLQGSRWPGVANAPVTITWSFIPDGTNIPSGFAGDPAGQSNFFAQMDAKFGAANRAVWIAQFQACFDRWAAITGTSYTRVTFNGNAWDDGASFPNSSGSAGARGDVRIGGRNIDGANGILAYNNFPSSGGDMVVDTSENWANATNSYRFLRNTLTHEHGHGLGLLHVCPTNGTKLMEPFLNTVFDGPQHDDLRGAMNLYGDAYESNNTFGTATNLGALASGGSITPSAEPAPAISNGTITSIGVNGDEDWYRLSIATVLPINVSVTPRGLNYDNSTQAGDGTCNSGSLFNSLAVAPLSVEIRGSTGTTVLAANAAAAGATALVSNISVPAGIFYVRVFETSAPAQSQLYDVTITAGSVAAPGNDNCASAAPIGPGTIVGSTVGATADGGDLCRGDTNLDVWYDFVPTCTGTMTLDTCGSSLDTVLSVHSGCPGATANSLDCNDDNLGVGPCPGGATSYLAVPVTAGVSYKIRVAGFSGAVGAFTLNVAFQGVTNDLCSAAAPLTPGATYTGFTCGATNDGSASCGSSQSSRDVWYSYTPSCNHLLGLDTCGSNYDTVLTVFSGACAALFEAGCDDDADAGTACPLTPQSALSIPVTAGVHYLIRVSGFNGAAGDYTLNVAPAAPTNDLCADATVVLGDYSGTTCGAGREVNDTCQAASTSGDVWLQWVAPCSGQLLVDTCESSYDTVISVHTGSCGALTEIGCNDDAASLGGCPFTQSSFLSVPVTSGLAYYVRVSGFQGDAGLFHVRLRQQPNDHCTEAAVANLGVTPFDTTCANTDASSSCGSTQGSPDVWYIHTATCTGPLWVDLCGSTYDTTLNAFSGPCGSLVELACNDDQNARCAVSGLHSFIAFRVTSGTPYYLRLSGFGGNHGAGVMNIRCCVADFNLSGVVSVQDIFDFLAGYFAADPRADVNASGAISVQDIFDFLAAYFAGCA